ncbi:uncharacterized protein METZ01_LOCUS171437, partial [marine metagenome]
VNPKYTNIWCILLVEVEGIETTPPKYMQGYEIIDYYWSSKNTNETSLSYYSHTVLH